MLFQGSSRILAGRPWCSLRALSQYFRSPQARVAACSHFSRLRVGGGTARQGTRPMRLFFSDIRCGSRWGNRGRKLPFPWEHSVFLLLALLMHLRVAHILCFLFAVWCNAACENTARISVAPPADLFEVPPRASKICLSILAQLYDTCLHGGRNESLLCCRIWHCIRIPSLWHHVFVYCRLVGSASIADKF